MAPHSVGPEPEELSRAISELDLTTLRGTDGTADEAEPGNGPRYTRDQLLGIRSKSSPVDVVINLADVATSGARTPPVHTTAPPPTPEHPSAAPASQPSTTSEQPKKEEGAADEPTPQTDMADEGAAEEEPKKKKKKKSSGKNKKPAPTGFEEFYADPPITPEEHVEESDIYSEEAPHIHTTSRRIETCIQRYRARRRLDSVRNNILTKYFSLGGIESGAKAFNGGLDTDTLENSTAAEIAAIQATDFIRTGSSKYYDPENDEHWVVDWEGVAKGFLSYRAPKLLGDEEHEVRQYSAVVRNFLNYVLAHGVCPEYTKEVMAARKICDLAEKEFKNIADIQLKLPGDFNIAASTIYGGEYKDRLAAYAEWANPGDDPNGWSAEAPMFSEAIAQFIFKGVVAMVGTKDHYDRAIKDGIFLTQSQARCFEVVGVELASDSAIKEFACIKDPRGLGSLKPVGKLFVKHWEGPGFEEEDMTDDESVRNDADGPIEELWVENHILEHCYEGLKLEVIVRELNIGVRYFDRCVGLYPSFHLYLPNEKMTGWKDPIPNERPPPTEDDPEVEEAAMNAIMDDEARDLE
ncbi:Argonaute subunit Arb1 protein [Rutstroemia sp. NJR-2017a WRK4]|nr:Argonaute subunit Arb1 protein [Rutstroemia sp. NJR-2017a WRK4]